MKIDMKKAIQILIILFPLTLLSQGIDTLRVHHLRNLIINENASFDSINILGTKLYTHSFDNEEFGFKILVERQSPIAVFGQIKGGIISDDSLIIYFYGADTTFRDFHNLTRILIFDKTGKNILGQYHFNEGSLFAISIFETEGQKINESLTLLYPNKNNQIRLNEISVVDLLSIRSMIEISNERRQMNSTNLYFRTTTVEKITEFIFE